MKYKPTQIISFVNIELLRLKWELIGPSQFFFERHVHIKPNLPMDLWFLKLMRNQGSQALRIVAFCIETFPYPNLAKCTISKSRHFNDFQSKFSYNLHHHIQIPLATHTQHDFDHLKEKGDDPFILKQLRNNPLFVKMW